MVNKNPDEEDEEEGALQIVEGDSPETFMADQEYRLVGRCC